MTTKLYTAAEARRIDIERGGEGKIRFPKTTEDSYVLETDNPNIFESHEVKPILVYPSDEMFAPFTPKPELDGEEEHLLKIEQLQKENESLLAERNRLREWYEDYYTKQPTIEHLQEVLQNALDSREDLKKELAEATQNYHEILADHGELTYEFDELKEKARKRECAHELPEREKRIYYFDTPGRLMGHGGYYPAIGCFVLNTLFACVELTDAQVKFWTWKYEADL